MTTKKSARKAAKKRAKAAQEALSEARSVTEYTGKAKVIRVGVDGLIEVIS